MSDIPKSDSDINVSINTPTTTARDRLLKKIDIAFMVMAQHGIHLKNDDEKLHFYAGVRATAAYSEAVDWVLALFTTELAAIQSELIDARSILPLFCGHDSLECHCSRTYVVSLEAINQVFEQHGITKEASK